MLNLLKIVGFFTGFTLIRLSWQAIRDQGEGREINLSRMSKEEIRDLLDCAADDHTRSVLQSYL